MARQLGASHFASEGWEIQRSNHFAVSIPIAGRDVIELSVSSAVLPTESNAVTNVHFGNTNITVAGKFETQGGNMVVKDVIQKDTQKLIDDWRASVFNKNTDAVGFAYDYKKQCTITQYAPDGSYERAWKCEGVWPQSVSYGNLTYDNSNLMEITINLQYDKCRLIRN